MTFLAAVHVKQKYNVRFLPVFLLLTAGLCLLPGLNHAGFVVEHQLEAGGLNWPLKRQLPDDLYCLSCKSTIDEEAIQCRSCNLMICSSHFKDCKPFQCPLCRGDDWRYQNLGSRLKEFQWRCPACRTQGDIPYLEKHVTECKGYQFEVPELDYSGMLPDSSPALFMGDTVPGIAQPDSTEDWDLQIKQQAAPDIIAPLPLMLYSQLYSNLTLFSNWHSHPGTDYYESSRGNHSREGLLRIELSTESNNTDNFPKLTHRAFDQLISVSPAMAKLDVYINSAGLNPLGSDEDLHQFVNEQQENKDSDIRQGFVFGSSSLVVKWPDTPGIVLKVARSPLYYSRFRREQEFYLWLQQPGNMLLSLCATPLIKAFDFAGKPVLALREIDYIARNRIRIMRKAGRSFHDRLDFALNWIWHFTTLYTRFLQQGVLLGDRHGDNIGFNEVVIPGSNREDLAGSSLQTPVMLDFDPYYREEDSMELQASLPAWVPVVMDLLEETFGPEAAQENDAKARQNTIIQLRKHSAFSLQPQRSDNHQEKIKQLYDSSFEYWKMPAGSEGFGDLLAEATPRIRQLLQSTLCWNKSPRPVKSMIASHLDEMARIERWLKEWKNSSCHPLLQTVSITAEPKGKDALSQKKISNMDHLLASFLVALNGQINCPDCARTFSTVSPYRRHMAHHKRNRIVCCTICHEGYTDIEGHIRTHRGELSYPCVFCKKRFVKAYFRNRHVKRVHTKTKPYKCTRCPLRFSDRYQMKNHELRKHTRIKSHKCSHCPKTFFTPWDRARHVRMTHNGSRCHKCPHCIKAFNTAWERARHEHRVHKGSESHKLSHCPQGFHTREGVRYENRMRPEYNRNDALPTRNMRIISTSTALARAFDKIMELNGKSSLSSKEISELRLSLALTKEKQKQLEAETASLKNKKAALEEQTVQLRAKHNIKQSGQQSGQTRHRAATN